MGASLELSHLIKLPCFPVMFETARREYPKQVLSIIDRASSSKSTVVKDAASKPDSKDHVKWEVAWDRAEDPEYGDYEEIIEHFVRETDVYLKASLGKPGSSGKSFQFEKLPREAVPARVKTMLEQRARMLTDKQQEEPQGMVVAEPDGDTDLIRTLDCWFVDHQRANKRLYYVARDLLKNLMESEGDR